MYNLLLDHRIYKKTNNQHKASKSSNTLPQPLNIIIMYVCLLELYKGSYLTQNGKATNHM